MSPKPRIETGNRIVETGNGNISLTYRILIKKTHFTKYFPFNPKSPKPVIERGNRIIKTGNGINSPTYRHLIKKLLLQNIFHSTRRDLNKLRKQEIEVLEQEM